MDMPIHNDEAKYFLADFHKEHTLAFKAAPKFVVDLDQSPSDRWRQVASLLLCESLIIPMSR